MYRATNVRHHLSAMRKRGHTAKALLAGTGIVASQLDDPGYLVSMQQCHALVANMLRLSGDPALGFEIGLQTELADLGIVGYAMSSAATMGQAINIWVQYGNSPVGFPFTLRMIEPVTKGGWGVAASPIGISGAVYRFYVEETLALGLRLGPMLLGQPMELDELALAYSAPAHRQRYEELFACPIRFDAAETRILARGPRLSTPTHGGNPEVRELCIRHCRQLLREINRGGELSARLRAALRARGSIPSLEEAAASLAMSPRSLRRHLRNEQTSFQKVLDEFRCDLAQEYLRAGMMPTKEVAYLLGFSHADSFRRAFKAWTGQTIGDALERSAG